MATISKVKPPKCKNCSTLERELDRYKNAFEALEALALWYEGGNAVASSHRIRKAMDGIPPVQPEQ